MSRQDPCFSHIFDSSLAHTLRTQESRQYAADSSQGALLAVIECLSQPFRAVTTSAMVDWTQDLGGYLESNVRSHPPLFAIFPNWTQTDYDEVCSRIQEAITEAGIPLDGSLPRLTMKNGRVSFNAAYRLRMAAETLLFGRYNQDQLLSLPHQKDPSVPRPSWFQESMLTPGPHSIRQKLLTVSYRRIKEEATGRRKTLTLEQIAQSEQQANQTDQANDHRSPAAESESTLTAQAEPSTSSASAVGSPAAAEQLLRPRAVANIESRPKKHNLQPQRFEDLTIHVGNIFELEEQLIMRRTFRDPQSWVKSSAGDSFDFEKVCKSVGVTAGWEKELFFFPDVSKDPHNILDEDELQGGIQYLCTQNAKEGRMNNISLFVAADIDHVRALSLDQRGKFRFDTISLC